MKRPCTQKLDPSHLYASHFFTDDIFEDSPVDFEGSRVVDRV